MPESIIYTIVADYGYGERSVIGYYYSEKELVDAYNDCTNSDYKTAKEIMDIRNVGLIYMVYNYEYKIEDYDPYYC